MEIKDIIRSTSLFGSLPDSCLDHLSQTGEWKTYEAGETVFRLGDPSDSMYVVAEGELDVFISEETDGEIPVNTIGPKDVVGEIQLLTGGERLATVRSRQNSRLIRVRKDAFEKIAEAELDFAQKLNEIILERIKRNQLTSILPKIFGSLEPSQVERLESLADWVQLPQGDVLFQEGDEGDSFYVLVSGLLGISVKDPNGDSILINRIKYGEVVGEMALLSEEPRSGTIHAVRDAELVRYHKDEFFRFLEQYPKLLLQITRLIVARLRQSMSQNFNKTHTSFITLVPASSNAPLAEFSTKLNKALESLSSVLSVNCDSIERDLATPGIARVDLDSPQSARVAAWLSAQEDKYEYILLQAEHADSPWTQRCMQQSDQIITIGLAGEEPCPQGVERKYVYDSDRLKDIPKRLVIIHPEECIQPNGTKHWLKPRDVEMHHHLKISNQKDFQRLSRFITDQAICLALGGGGARGFSHAGALRALNEKNIPIDIIGGTSMGAIIGGMYALGIEPDQMVKRFEAANTKNTWLRQLTLPLLSFVDGGGYADAMRKIYGDVDTEDLWLPFFCVSSNISRACMKVHRDSPLWRNIRASSGIQGLFPPVIFNGELHVDGALFSNLPADVMKKTCNGNVIAIDVTPPVDLAQNAEYGESISGWKILWNKFIKRDKTHSYPDIGTVLQRAGEAVSNSNQKKAISETADFYIRMPVDHINILDFKRSNELENIGYMFAKEMLEKSRNETLEIPFLSNN
ncbi:MAG: cyclic nucleotide-binding and patatin-like phospholipase domain-containing protein [Candidatus Latescibacterota bacterium]|nr:cyclic nucleotide-binding and patatin-like phospholipase domain-containing protein [Candidatus Latescibacterota bacterium]